MTALIFTLLFMPVCATIAGLAIGAGYRGQSLDDGDLIRHFLVVLVVCIAILAGVSRTDSARMHLDPQFRIQTELDAHRVYATLKRTASQDHVVLDKFLTLQISQGATLSDAFLQARSMLTQLANERFGWADQKTRLVWAQFTVDTLKELQARDPVLCYRALASKPLDQKTLARGFSAANTKAFQQTLIAVYESASQDARKKRSPSSEPPISFHEAALEYRVIQDEIARQFGVPISRQLNNSNIRNMQIDLAEPMCAARIAQLEAMLQRPPAIAASLLDSVLR